MVKKVSQEVSRKRVKIQKAYDPFWEGMGGCPGRGGGVNPSRLGGFGAEG